MAPGAAEASGLEFVRKDSDPGNRFASSLLFDNCPWLKLTALTPESGIGAMAVDSAPGTPGGRQPVRAPWMSEFADSGLGDTLHGDELSHSLPALRRQMSSSSSENSNQSGYEAAPPCIVLAPVPKCLRRARSIDPTPHSSQQASPHHSVMVVDEPLLPSAELTL